MKYIKAESYECDDFPSRVWISENFESLKYRKLEVTSYKEYSSFVNSDWPSGNYFKYHEGFSLDEEGMLDCHKEGEPEHEFFGKDGTSLLVGVFNCHNEDWNFGGYRTHILAGCTVYIMNEHGDTIDKVDLTK